MSDELASRASSDRGRGGAATLVSSDLRHAHQRVFASDRPAIQRLVHVPTTVAFRVDGRPEQSFTMRVDRRPCEVVDVEPSEIEIVLSAVQAGRAATGALSLTAAILAGDVEVRGPVRKYLEIEPIIRGALQDEVGSTGDAEPERGGGVVGADIDPELLAIETRGLHKAFGSNAVLRGLDLGIP